MNMLNIHGSWPNHFSQQAAPNGKRHLPFKNYSNQLKICCSAFLGLEAFTDFQTMHQPSYLHHTCPRIGYRHWEYHRFVIRAILSFQNSKRGHSDPNPIRSILSICPSWKAVTKIFKACSVYDGGFSFPED